MVGEHIRALKGGRWIHAIDCGDETVLHLVEDVAPPRVRRAYRPEFVAGAASVEHVTHRERTFPPKEVVRRAYSRAADPALAVMFRDSEAFAEWCTNGRLPGPPNVAVGVTAIPAAGATPAAPRRARVPARKRAPAAKARGAANGSRKAPGRSAKKAAAKNGARGAKRPAAHAKTARVAKRAASPAKRKRAARPSARRPRA